MVTPIVMFVFHAVSVANKKSLVVDYNTLANEQQVIAFFLPEAPTEMLKIFDEVSSRYSCKFVARHKVAWSFIVRRILCVRVCAACVAFTESVQSAKII